ncbi:hypothetical protein [Streptomyces bicolor]|uniref:hypothetical protein n=1 Tax=Streptomyces bicolor TaxID=66874 RepID=UPI00068C790F|nr:hypothetical protein [Streptomyces bicolor]
MHTGGGALAAALKFDPDSYKEDGHEKDSWGGDHDKDSWKGDEHGKESWGGDHDKPHGGMHTGGGGLAEPGVTAGGLAMLAVAGTGVYALRRKKASGTAA